MTRASKVIVLYDADCGFCRWSLAKLLAWDRNRRLRPVAIGSPEGRRLLGDLSEEERWGSWHLVDADGRSYSAGAAAPVLLRRLPAGRLPAALLARFPTASERIYAWVARNRGGFGGLLGGGAKRRADRRISERESGRG